MTDNDDLDSVTPSYFQGPLSFANLKRGYYLDFAPLCDSEIFLWSSEHSLGMFGL